MKTTQTKLKDCFIIEPTVFGDERGYFYESFNSEKFAELTKLTVEFVQDNQSKSSYGVLRGLHFQRGAYAQAKLVRVLSGSVLDIAVDIRESSATYGQYESIVLSADNKRQLFIPKGFAHGFVVLSSEAEFFYKCDNYYNKESEAGIIYNDTTLNINWEIPKGDIKISEKDDKLDTFLNLADSEV